MACDFEREGLPTFLRSFEDLTAHFDEHFNELGSNERGDSFLSLAEKAIPLVDEFAEFPPPFPSERKSHDGGVDLLTAETRDGRILCVQSKYKIRDKSAFDSIISKFKDFEVGLRPPKEQLDLYPQPDLQSTPPVASFAIVTSSKLEGILQRYEESTLASKSYYAGLRSEGRLTILDGPRILLLLQQLYKKSHLLPASVQLTSLQGWFQASDVYLGAVPATQIAALYAAHGDALFFENIRDFLGTSSGRVVSTRSTVNQEIIETVQKHPERMLARNNGITFRASTVKRRDNETLTLERTAIVNGCQTTMCLVHCSPVSSDCYIPVKVVTTEDAWDIAKAANYQNHIHRVDLDLARYLRPQLVRRVAASLGYAVETDSDSSASAVLNTIYRNKVEYAELRLLYLGLFSRKPNNVFEANYTELRADVLEQLYEAAPNEEQIFTVILMLLNQSRSALDNCQSVFSGPEYAHLFKRFYKDDKPRYRAFLAIAGACAVTRDDISARDPGTESETMRMRSFLGKCRDVLENQPGRYMRAYRHAFAAVADSLLDVDSTKGDAEIQQAMFSKVSTMAFDALHKRILIRLDAEAAESRGNHKG